METECKKLRESVAIPVSLNVLGLSHNPIIRFHMAGISEDFSPETFKFSRIDKIKGYFRIFPKAAPVSVHSLLRNLEFVGATIPATDAMER